MNNYGSKLEFRPHYRVEAWVRYPKADAEDELQEKLDKAVRDIADIDGLVVFRTYPCSDYC